MNSIQGLRHAGQIPEIQPIDVGSDGITGSSTGSCQDPFDPDRFFTGFARSLFDRVLLDIHASLSFFLALGLDDTWTSLCAGTDSPSMGVQYVQSALSLLFKGVAWTPRQ